MSPRLGQEAGGRRQAETDVCSGLLEAEKCPLQSRAIAAGTRSGHFERGSCNRLDTRDAGMGFDTEQQPEASKDTAQQRALLFTCEGMVMHMKASAISGSWVDRGYRGGGGANVHTTTAPHTPPRTTVPY